MEKINKEELMEIAGLSEQDLAKAAGGDALTCIKKAIEANKKCLADAEAYKDHPYSYRWELDYCEKKYNTALRGC